MFSSNRVSIRWFLIAMTFITVPIQNALCASQGFVNFNLKLGPTKTNFTYVFSGLITCHNRPCSNARVDVDVVTATQGAIVRSTRTGEDGRYELAVTLLGNPQDSSLWKIEAHSPAVSDLSSAEAEGRIILMEDQKTVVVDRSLFLTQA